MVDKILQFLLNFLEAILPIFYVFSYEGAVFYRGGKFVKTITPGWYLKIPFFDSFHKDIVTTDTMRIEDVTITTLDGKTVTLGGEFDLTISDIKKAVNDTHEWRSNLQDISRGIISDSLEDINWDDIRKKTTKNAIEKRIQKRGLEMGITINNFSFTDKSISRAFKLYGTIDKNNSLPSI